MLKKYEEQLEREREKAASRNIKPILEFLERWKDHVRIWHENAIPQYIRARESLKEAESAHRTCRSKYFHTPVKERDKEAFERVKSSYDTARKDFASAWSRYEDYLLPERDPDAEYSCRINYELLDKDLNREVELKYDDLVERTNAIVGEITDAGGLRVGEKGDLNGTIKGTRGNASVTTVGAGGYNIQCFHFRTLINDATKKEKKRKAR